MEEHDQLKKKHTRRRLIRILLLETIIFLSILGFLYYRSVSSNTTLYVNEQEVVEQTVETNINQYLFVLDTLESYYHTYSDGDMSMETFHHFLSVEEMERLGIEFVVISPNNITELTYPNDVLGDTIGTDISDIFEPYILGMYYQAIEGGNVLVTKKLEEYHGHDVVLIASPIKEDNVETGVIGLYINYESFSSNNIGVFDGKTLNVSLFDTNDNVIVGDFSKNQASYDYEKLNIDRVDIYMGNIISPAHYSSTRLELIVQLIIISVIGVAAIVLTIWSYYSNQNFINQLREIAFIDQITGLPNDKQLEEDVTFLIKKKQPFHVAYGVFDNIKYVVDKFEQSIGDQAQIYISERILDISKNTMRLYKYSEDTFVLLRVSPTPDDLVSSLMSILNVLEKPIQLRQSTYKLSMHFGIVSYPTDDVTLMNLMKKANSLTQELIESHTELLALYRDKHDKEKLTHFDIDNIVKNISMEAFEVHMQPFVNCVTGEVVGYELLSRPQLKDKKAGIQEIVTALERTGRIKELDYHVMNKGCEYLSQINKTHPDIWISINISPYNLNDKLKDFLIRRALEQKLDPRNIVLEVLESKDIFDNKSAMGVINELADIGFKFSIDDFGTGYSSLNSISMIPLAYLKIDKKYVQSKKSNTFDQQILQTLINLSEKLDFTVIAEGVETKEQLKTVRNMGYQIYQGWYFSKAVEFKKAYAMLKPSKKTR